MDLRQTIAALIAFVFFGLNSSVVSTGPSLPTTPTDYADQVIRTLQSTHIYIGPEEVQDWGSSRTGPIERQLHQDDTPIFVAFLPLDIDFTFRAVDWLKQKIGTPGVYIVVSSSYGAVGETSSLSDVSDVELAAVMTEKSATLGPTGTVIALIKYAQEHHKKAASSEHGLSVWWLFGPTVLVVGVALFLARRYRWFRS